VPEAERNEAFEAKWQEGGSISYLYTYTDLLVNKAANDTASEFARNKIRGIVQDKRTAELLAPKDIRSAPNGSASIPTTTRPTIGRT